ncbi:MAG TPA: TonB family protein, partial [Thermoanaerobaculia bacterium]|nr:TonB family protein [Thermoanaerobaculia bacterium]
MKHQLLATIFAAAFTAGAVAQQSGTPASQPAQELPDGPQPTTVQPNGPTVVMDTSMGQITCQFFQKQAPVAVANFIGLANGTKDWTDPATGKKMRDKPFFDGTTFHRVIPEFMIQGGDPTGTGTGDPGYSFNDEFDPNLNFDVPGRLALANSGPNTNGSQFFITEQAYATLNQHYTIFGQCDEPSVNVVKTIARVQRDSNDKPLTPVTLNKVTIESENGAPPPQAGGGGSVVAEPPKRVNISAGVAVGMLESKTPPAYPAEAKQKGISGRVILDTIIGTDGTVQELKVVSGPEGLQQAALDAVKSWRYRPYLLNGDPVEVRTTVNVIF